MDKNTYFYTLPRRIYTEIESVLKRRGKSINSICEIRLRADALSSFYLDGTRYVLANTATQQELSETVKALCRGSVYSHLGTIKDGYIALEGGIRVGISARARYDGDRLCSFDEASSLVFRIPSESLPSCEDLLAYFRECRRGMLIFSPPRYGKTSALRALASALSLGRDGLEVALLDERLEFCALDRRGRSLDLLSGYKKKTGIEIALRSLAPDVIIMDELSDLEECSAILEFMRGGARVAASVHARSLEDLKSKSGVARLIDNGVFDKFVGIEISEGKRVFRKYD